MSTSYEKINPMEDDEQNEDFLDFKTYKLNTLKSYGYICKWLKKVKVIDCCYKKYAPIYNLDK